MSTSTQSHGCAPASWTERMVRRFAGVFIVVSLVLGWKVHPGWFFFTAFVGANLFQSSFTNFCPLEMILRRVEKRRTQTDQAPIAS